jgi:hypothetical protein
MKLSRSCCSPRVHGRKHIVQRQSNLLESGHSLRSLHGVCWRGPRVLDLCRRHQDLPASLAKIKPLASTSSEVSSGQLVVNMSTGEGINEPLLPPLQSLTPTNRGPLALVTANTLVVITTLTVAVKLWTRYATTRTLGLNDAAMMAATV